MNTKIHPLKLLIALLACYLCVVARWGYEYGRNDEMQTQAYAKFLNSPDLYPLDNYLQGIHAKVPNERFAFSYLLSLSGDYLEWMCALLHVLITLLHFLLLYKIGRLFIKTDYLVWLALLVIFVPLYGVNLGGNELYYNSFFVSNLVQLTGLFGIFQLLKERYILALFTFGLATLLQPVIGTQLFVTCAGVLFLGKILGAVKIEWWRWFVGVFAFVLTGGLWVIFLKFFFEDKGITNAQFFEILFEFRSPHHYLPMEYGWANYLIIIPLLIFGTVFYLIREKKIGLFFLISWLGMLAYFILVEGFSEVNTASLQWFKMTIWMEAFSVFAVFAILEKKLLFLQEKILNQIAFPVLACVGAGVLYVLIFSRSLIFWNVPFDLGNQRQTEAAANISYIISKKTAKDALFLHPINFTTLKVYGERSSMVDYKVLVHRKVAMADWYKRIGDAYGVDADSRKVGLKLFDLADENYRNLGEIDIKNLQEKYGITHFLTFKNHQLNFPQIIKNEEFIVYFVD